MQKEWLKNILTHSSIDSSPIPWLTLESIIWLLRNTSDCSTLFEWGAGASTRFFEDLFEVTTIEHDKKWSSGCTYIPVDTEDYPKAMKQQYDIVLIDGRRRVECIQNSIPFVRKFLVLDNSERPRYVEGHNSVPNEWIRRDFPGYGRKNPWEFGKYSLWMTTIYEKI